MVDNLDAIHLATLQAYSNGEMGTREAIQNLGVNDYADLLILLSRQELKLPKPSRSKSHTAHVARATEILQPLLHDR